MEKQYRYLMNGEVVGSDKQYPNDESMFYKRKDDTQNWGDFLLKQWLTSLVKLECSEVELVKILSVFEPDKTIDITSITTVNSDCCGKCAEGIDNCDGKIRVYFKEVESESQEQLLSELAECIIANKNGLCSTPTILKQFTITRKC